MYFNALLVCKGGYESVICSKYSSCDGPVVGCLSGFALLWAGPVLILIITFIIPLARLHSTPKEEGTDFHLPDAPHSAEGMNETKHSFT